MPMSDRPVQSENEDIGAWIDRLHVWEVESGEICHRCGRYTSTLAAKLPGHRKLCYQCRMLAESKDEVISEKFLRCPKCLRQWEPYASEDFAVFGEGNHEIECGSCEHRFEISTSIAYRFHNPAIIQGTPNAETTQ